MSQEEIIKFLEEHPERWFSLTEISQELDISVSHVSNAVKQMAKYKEIDVEFRKIIARIKFKKEDRLSDII